MVGPKYHPRDLRGPYAMSDTEPTSTGDAPFMLPSGDNPTPVKPKPVRKVVDVIDPDDVDPDDPGLDGPPQSALAELAAEMERDVEQGSKRFPNPARPGWLVSFDLDLPDPHITRLRKASQKGKRDKNTGEPLVDVVKLAALILGSKATAIYNPGARQVMDSDGDPMTFTSREFLDMCGASTVEAAVRKFYVDDGTVVAVSNAYVAETSWAAEAEGIDGDDDEDDFAPHPPVRQS